MDSYNLVNGEHSTQNSHLNNDILRHDWGFRAS
jgi:beta-glucosidase